MKDLLTKIGYDEPTLDIDSMLETFDKVMSNFFTGYKSNLNNKIKKFDSYEDDYLIKLKDFYFISFDHISMLPFFGSIDIDYIPSSSLFYADSFNSIINTFSRRFQTPDILLSEIMDFVEKTLDPKYLKITLNYKSFSIKKDHHEISDESISLIIGENNASK